MTPVAGGVISGGGGTRGAWPTMKLFARVGISKTLGSVMAMLKTQNLQFTVK